MQLIPGVVRSFGTPPMRREAQVPQTAWAVAWFWCGLVSLVPAALLSLAYCRHILQDRDFWSWSGLWSLIIGGLLSYSLLLAGPFTIVLSSLQLRYRFTERGLRAALLGGALASLAPLAVLLTQRLDNAVLALAAPAAGASLFVVGTTAWHLWSRPGAPVA